MTDYAGEPAPVPGSVLREILAQHGISQDELAKAIGVSRLTINQIVNNKRTITFDTAARLAKAFKTTPIYWLDLQRNFDLFLHATAMKRAADAVRCIV